MAESPAPPGLEGGASLSVTVMEWPAEPGGLVAMTAPTAEPPPEHASVELWLRDGHVSGAPSLRRRGAARATFTNQPVEAWDEVRAAYLLGGWPRVRELTQAVRDKLRAAQSRPDLAAYVRPAAMVWEAYAPLPASLSEQVRAALVDIEQATRALVMERLARSHAMCHAEARRYLHQVPERPGVPVHIPDTAPLAPDRTHVDGLREELTAVAGVTAAIEAEEKRLAKGLRWTFALPPAMILETYRDLDPKVQQLTQKRADVVAAGSIRHPLLARIWRVNPGIDDDGLADEIRTALTDTSLAAVDVAVEMEANPAVRHPAIRSGLPLTPEKLAELREWPPAENPAGRLATLVDTPSNAGPWAFPMALAAAADRHGWTPSTLHGAALREVLSGVGGDVSKAYAGTAALLAGQVLLGLVCPPVAVAVDVASAVFDAVTAIERYLAEDKAALAILAPDEAIAGPPNARELTAAAIGVLSAGVPGNASMFVSGMQAVVMYAP